MFAFSPRPQRDNLVDTNCVQCACDGGYLYIHRAIQKRRHFKCIGITAYYYYSFMPHTHARTPHNMHIKTNIHMFARVPEHTQTHTNMHTSAAASPHIIGARAKIAHVLKCAVCIIGIGVRGASPARRAQRCICRRCSVVGELPRF